MRQAFQPKMQRDQVSDVGLVLDDEDTGTLRVFRSRRLINCHVSSMPLPVSRPPSCHGFFTVGPSPRHRNTVLCR